MLQFGGKTYIYVTICPASCYNLPCIRVICNTLDLIKRIITQMCIALNIYLYTCFLWEIFAVSLALKLFRWVTIRTAILKYAVFVATSPGLSCGQRTQTRYTLSRLRHYTVIGALSRMNQSKEFVHLSQSNRDKATDIIGSRLEPDKH